MAERWSLLLKFVANFYKAQIMCTKVINTYLSTIKFVLEYYQTDKMYNKAINTCYFVLFLFMINIRLKKYVTALFPGILL